MNKLSFVLTKKAEKGLFSIGNPAIKFDYDGFQITIEDCVKRNVSIESSEEVDVINSRDIFIQLNGLCMICDGCFHDIEKVYYDDEQKNIEDLQLVDYNSLKTDFYGPHLSLISIREVLSSDFLKKWIEINAELIYPNSAFFYMTHIGGLPIDLRTAYITECYEPLAHFIEEFEEGGKTKYKPIPKKKKIPACVSVSHM